MAALVEHYVCVGVGEQLELSDDFPEAGRWFDNAYRPALLCEFPPSRPLPSKLALSGFCLPAGLRIWTAPQDPSFACFVLTQTDGERLYGHCLTVYVPLPDATKVQLIAQGGGDGGGDGNAVERLAAVGELSGGMTYFAPRCLCVLSRLHFPLAFKASLVGLHRMCMSSLAAPLQVAVETALSHLICNVPLPLPGGPTVRFCLGQGEPKLHVACASPTELPAIDYSVGILLSRFSAGAIERVFHALLLEQQACRRHSSLLPAVRLRSPFGALRTTLRVTLRPPTGCRRDAPCRAFSFRS